MADKKNIDYTRSMEHGGWYWVDKAVIRKYSGNVGFLALAVYHLLASMTDESQTCYPSQKYGADRLFRIFVSGVILVSASTRLRKDSEYCFEYER